MRKFFVLVCSLFLFVNVSFAAEEHTLVIQPGPDEGKDTVYGTAFFTDGQPDLELFTIGGWADHYYSYVQFNLAEIPADAEITGAELSLYQYKDKGSDNYGKAEIVVEAWEEDGVSREDNPQATDVGIPWSFVSATPHWWNQDLTQVVELWLSEEYPNYGLKLRGQLNSNDAGRRFYSSDYLDDPTLRPKLTITYTLPEVEKSVTELNDQLLTQVEEGVDSRPIKNSYLAHLKKLLQFYEESQINAAVNQLGAFLRKLSADGEQGDVAPETQLELEETANELLEKIQTVLEDTVVAPLMTQIASPYPPESAEWADDVYAEGAADYPGSCGATIAQCGCTLTSFAMLGQSYGLTEGVDGSEATPGNINRWLELNNGYSSTGDINWSQALKYFGNPNIPESSYLKLINPRANESEVRQHLVTSGPVITKTRATNQNGSQFDHFILVTDITGNSYEVRDPLWYNTMTMNDDVGGQLYVQDYDDDVLSGRLISYSPEATKVARAIEIKLASPAELVLKDSAGRRLGKDPITGEEYSEIPGGVYYYDEAVYSEQLAESGVPPHVTKVLYVSQPKDNNYQLEVIGTDVGAYSLSVLTIDETGEDVVTEIEGVASKDSIDSYLIDVEVGDEELIQIIDAAITAVNDLPEALRERVLRKLEVVRDLVEKDNLVAADRLTAGLLMQLAKQDITDTELVTLLTEFGEAL